MSYRTISKKFLTFVLCCGIVVAVVLLSMKSDSFRHLIPGIKQLVDKSDHLRVILAALGERRSEIERMHNGTKINANKQRSKARNSTSRVEKDGEVKDDDDGRKGLPSMKKPTKAPPSMKKPTKAPPSMKKPTKAPPSMKKPTKAPPSMKKPTKAKSVKVCRDEFLSEFQTKKRFVCSSMNGGLGNRMFAYASAYGMASASNRTVVMERTNFLIKHFNVKAKIVDDFCVCDNAKRVYERLHCAFKETLMNMTGNLNYRPRFYLQSWKYFRHVVRDIRDIFTFKPSVQLKAQGIIRNKLKEIVRKTKNVTDVRPDIVTVGIHARRGNMVTKNGTMGRGYNPPPPSYFKNAMDYYRGKYKAVAFLVCSNGMKWCKQHLTGNDVTFVVGNSYDIDLAVLSQCNHSIISVGTFGWWSAFLAGGDVIYYAHPAKNGSGYAKEFSKDKSDYFYPGWIALE